MTSVALKTRQANSEDKLCEAQRNNSRDSTHYKSGTTGLPHLLSSIYSNYRDKTLSLTKNKRFSVCNTKSVFKFRETEKVVGSIKLSTGNIELVDLKSKTRRLQDEVTAVNARNSNLVKKLNLIKYISKSRPTNQLVPQTNNYLQECIDFSAKCQSKKNRIIAKLEGLNEKIDEKRKQNGILEKTIQENKQAYVQLRAKRDSYATVLRKTRLCEEKSKTLRRQLDGDKEVVFAAHDLTLRNEKLQLEKLQYEIARYVIDGPSTSNSNQVRRLVLEARELEMRKKYGV